jgi:hypothetical protein
MQTPFSCIGLQFFLREFVDADEAESPCAAFPPRNNACAMSDIQSFNYTLLYITTRTGVFVQLAILVIAFIAAWRCKLKGLWLLAAAAALLALRDIIKTVMPLSYLVNSSSLMGWWPALDYIPFFAGVVALIGWCLLSFSHRKDKKTAA